MKNLVTIQVGVTPEHRDNLQFIAKQLNVSVAWVVRMILDNYERQVLDAAESLNDDCDFIESLSEADKKRFLV